jgi:hypothetical protein
MVIQSFWTGGPLSAMERLSISSFLTHGHEFHLYVYSDVEGIPKGTTVFDASSVVSAEKVSKFRYSGSKSVAPFSNVFRYKLLHEKGGIWVDLDVICLKQFSIEEEYLFPRTNHILMWGRDPNLRSPEVDTWFIKAPPNSELMRLCYERACNFEGREVPWGTYGPVVLRTAVLELNLQNFVSHWKFFPVNWKRYEEFVSGSLRSRLVWHLFKDKSFVVHLYREMWMQGGLDPNAHFDQRCIYEQLKLRHL